MIKKNEVGVLFYTRTEAAKYLGLATSTIDVLVTRGLLASNKMGKRRLFPHAALEDFPKRNLARLWPKKIHGKTSRAGKPARAMPESKIRRGSIAC